MSSADAIPHMKPTPKWKAADRPAKRQKQTNELSSAQLPIAVAGAIAAREPPANAGDETMPTAGGDAPANAGDETMPTAGGDAPADAGDDGDETMPTAGGEPPANAGDEIESAAGGEPAANAGDEIDPAAFAPQPTAGVILVFAACAQLPSFFAFGTVKDFHQLIGVNQDTLLAFGFHNCAFRAAKAEINKTPLDRRDTLLIVRH